MAAVTAFQDARGLRVDGICGSTYGTTNKGADWTQEFGYVINKYNKPVWSCEYTDDHRALINGVMRALRGRLSGLAQPTYVLDIPGGFGKVPIGLGYLKKETSGTYETAGPDGRQHRYQD